MLTQKEHDAFFKVLEQLIENCAEWTRDGCIFTGSCSWRFSLGQPHREAGNANNRKLLFLVWNHSKTAPPGGVLKHVCLQGILLPCSIQTTLNEMTSHNNIYLVHLISIAERQRRVKQPCSGKNLNDRNRVFSIHDDIPHHLLPDNLTSKSAAFKTSTCSRTSLSSFDFWSSAQFAQFFIFGTSVHSLVHDILFELLSDNTVLL